MSGMGLARLEDMVTEIQRIVMDTSTARETDIKQSLNRVYDAVSAQMEWPQLIQADETGLRKRDEALATIESGEAEVPLPISAATLRQLMFQSINAEPIEIVTPGRLFEMAGADLDTTGRPRFAAVIGTTAQYRRLSADGTLTVLCPDSSSNNNVYSVTVEYAQSTSPVGTEAVEVVSGNFTAGVSLSASAEAGYPISKIGVPTGWVGCIRVQDGSGNVLVHVPNLLNPSATTAAGQHQTVANTLLRVWPVPDADYACTIIYQRKPKKLTLDSDTPEIPVSAYLVERVASELLIQENKAQLGIIHDQKAQAHLAALMRQSSLGPVVAVPKHPSFLAATGVFPRRGGW